MTHTWQFLRYLTEAAHYMTEVIADLEIDLQKKGIDVRPTTAPGDPPPPPSERDPCIPPPWCTMSVVELHKYANELRSYVDKVLQRTTEHVTAARENGVTEFSYRVVDTPENPKTKR
jgi:hypothetical protein